MRGIWVGRVDKDFIVTNGEQNSMAKKKKDSLVRVQFPKDSTAEDILAGIRHIQDKWAKKYPDRAHALYPEVFSETGERIKKDTKMKRKSKKGNG